MMDIAFCCNDAYAPYVCVALRSIADTYRGEARLHVFSDRLSPVSRERLAAAAAPLPLCVHIMDESPLAGLVTGRYTKYAWYRLLIPDCLPQVDRLLYLDTDVCVCDDLSPLARVDISDVALAVPPDTDSYTPEPYARCGYSADKGYFCSGVLLLNLDYWRRHDLPHKIIDWARAHAERLRYPDQDSINAICQDSKKWLPLRYGVTKSLFTEPWFYTPEYASQVLECLERPAVIHYAGCAPWLRESDHPMAHVWRRINASLPHPAPVRYATSGLLGLKLRLFDLLHPRHSRAAITPDEIKHRLNQITNDK